MCNMFEIRAEKIEDQIATFILKWIQIKWENSMVCKMDLNETPWDSKS